MKVARDGFVVSGTNHRPDICKNLERLGVTVAECKVERDGDAPT